MPMLLNLMLTNRQTAKDDLSVLFLVALIGAMLARRHVGWFAKAAWFGCIVAMALSFVVGVML